jgi:molybdopterin converting factor small subunit
VVAVLAWGRCPIARQWHRNMRVEFLGIPRERAGISELEVQADTLGQLLIVLEHRFPSFGGLIESGRLHPAFRANLNGDRFVSDPRTRLSSLDCVLILSADAGG